MGTLHVLLCQPQLHYWRVPRSGLMSYGEGLVGSTTVTDKGIMGLDRPETSNTLEPLFSSDCHQ